MTIGELAAVPPATVTMPMMEAETRELAGVTPELRESRRHLGKSEADERAACDVGEEVGCAVGCVLGLAVG